MALVQLNIPQGYRAELVPKDCQIVILPNHVSVTITEYKTAWEQLEIPTIQDVSDYTKVSVSQILRDLKEKNCPLITLNDGGKGRGKVKTFIKSSVEQYKKFKQCPL